MLWRESPDRCFDRWLKVFCEQWASLEVKDSEFYPLDNVVISRSHVYAVSRATGQAIDWPLLQYFKLRASRILELRPFHGDTASMLPALNAKQKPIFVDCYSSGYKGRLAL
jgi:hypothetical protein